MPTPDCDEIDLAILALLQESGRRTAADIARRVRLSPTAVKRRIERLEVAEIITGYSARVDYAKLGWGITAFTELRYTGNTSPDDMNRIASAPPEVVAVLHHRGPAGRHRGDPLTHAHASPRHH